jgi:tetratricopeptide (TPR) repeat protein
MVGMKKARVRKARNPQPDSAWAAEVSWLAASRVSKLLGDGRFDKALAVANREIERQPDFGLAYAARAGVVIEAAISRAVTTSSYEAEAESFKEALADCDRAIELAPEYPGPFGLRSLALRGLKQFDEADAAFRRAVALAPKNDPEWQSFLRRQCGFDESKPPGYTGKRPPSQADDTSQLEMGGDDFNIQVKQAKAEVLARAKPRPKPRSSTLQLATYRALAQNVDLLNPKLPEAERLQRARRLVHAYERVRERRPKFHDHNNPQLLAAFSIINKVKYRRSQAAKAAQKAALAM